MSSVDWRRAWWLRSMFSSWSTQRHVWLSVVVVICRILTEKSPRSSPEKLCWALPLWSRVRSTGSDLSACLNSRFLALSSFHLPRPVHQVWRRWYSYFWRYRRRNGVVGLQLYDPTRGNETSHEASGRRTWCANDGEIGCSDANAAATDGPTRHDDAWTSWSDGHDTARTDDDATARIDDDDTPRTHAGATARDDDDDATRTDGDASTRIHDDATTTRLPTNHPQFSTLRSSTFSRITLIFFLLHSFRNICKHAHTFSTLNMTAFKHTCQDELVHIHFFSHSHHSCCALGFQLRTVW